MSTRQNKDKRIYLIHSLLLFITFSQFPSCTYRSQKVKEPSPDVSVVRPEYKKKKGPIVLFDEGHNNMHKSAGSYKVFVAVIENDGYKVKINRAKFTRDILNGCKILVISNATAKETSGGKRTPNLSAFSQEEIEAVHDWVNEGGGLFLIADHAPWGEAAYEMAKRFGVILSKGFAIPGAPQDVQKEKRDNIKSKDKKPGLRVMTTTFNRNNDRILDHPVTKGRDESEKVSVIQTYTGESLLAPEGSGFLKLPEGSFDVAPVTKEKRPVSVSFKDGEIVRWESYGMDPKKNDNKKLALNIMHYLCGLLDPGVKVSSD